MAIPKQNDTNRGEMRQAGFTLVELIVTLIIIGILALVAVPRLFDRNTFAASSFGDATLAMIRYAQKLAVAQHRDVFVRLNANSIALCFDQVCASPVPAPSGTNSNSTATQTACGNPQWYCEGLPQGVTYVSPLSNRTFFFNALGRPFNAGDTPPNSSFNAALSFSITGGGVTRNVVIEQETGYVHE